VRKYVVHAKEIMLNNKLINRKKQQQQQLFQIQMLNNGKNLKFNKLYRQNQYNNKIMRFLMQ